jgi:hypothetical protein
VVLLSNMGSAALNITSAIGVDGVSMDGFYLHKMENSCPFDTGASVKDELQNWTGFQSARRGGDKTAQVIIEDDAPGSPHAVSAVAETINDFVKDIQSVQATFSVKQTI